MYRGNTVAGGFVRYASGNRLRSGGQPHVLRRDLVGVEGDHRCGAEIGDETVFCRDQYVAVRRGIYGKITGRVGLKSGHEPLVIAGLHQEGDERRRHRCTAAVGYGAGDPLGKGGLGDRHGP